MKKPRLGYITQFAAISLMFAVISLIIGIIPAKNDKYYLTSAESGEKAPVIVIDPGHGYTGSGKRYDKGNRVEIYYCEETDSACIKKDNPFFRKARVCRALCILCRIVAAFSAIAGVICLIIV